MKLQSTDFFLSQLPGRLPGLFLQLGDMETDLLGARLRSIDLDRPVFITGLARSGTTILLNMFAASEAVGTHRYRDFPFLFVPYWWSWISETLGRAEPPTERPHRDRIRINRDSPDAFEEPIWSHFFPFVHDPRALHVLGPQNTNPRFDAFFKDHLRKILLIRGRRRYVSKGNYNVTRLRYIAKLLPSALFVIPIRHPLDHVASLVRQHRLFSAYSETDRRVPAYLRAAGHFEFGPQRVPINVDEKTPVRVAEAWRAEQDALGYAMIWRTVYRYAAEAASGPDLTGRVRFVRYEDLCARPEKLLAKLFTFCGLEDQADEILRSLPSVSAPRHEPTVLTAGQRDAVWQESREIACRFGYGKDTRELSSVDQSDSLRIVA